MYQKIMIPLDGSKLAECVLPHVEAFLKNGLVKEVLLIRVMEPLPLGALIEAGTTLSTAPYQKFPEQLGSFETMQKKRKAAVLEYLKQIATGLSEYGTEIECRVLEGPVAETLASSAEENNIDLIIIATHGLSGIGRWLMGSIADRVMRSSCVPVLMVNAASCANQNKNKMA